MKWGNLIIHSLQSGNEEFKGMPIKIVTQGELLP